jgi:hypothetical protein
MLEILGEHLREPGATFYVYTEFRGINNTRSSLIWLQSYALQHSNHPPIADVSIRLGTTVILLRNADTTARPEGFRVLKCCAGTVTHARPCLGDAIAEIYDDA